MKIHLKIGLLTAGLWAFAQVGLAQIPGGLTAQEYILDYFADTSQTYENRYYASVSICDLPNERDVIFYDTLAYIHQNDSIMRVRLLTAKIAARFLRDKRFLSLLLNNVDINKDAEEIAGGVRYAPELADSLYRGQYANGGNEVGFSERSEVFDLVLNFVQRAEIWDNAYYTGDLQDSQEWWVLVNAISGFETSAYSTDTAVIAFLERALTHFDSHVRQYAADFLVQIGSKTNFIPAKELSVYQDGTMSRNVEIANNTYANTTLGVRAGDFRMDARLAALDEISESNDLMALDEVYGETNQTPEIKDTALAYALEIVANTTDQTKLIDAISFSADTVRTNGAWVIAGLDPIETATYNAVVARLAIETHPATITALEAAKLAYEDQQTVSIDSDNYSASDKQFYGTQKIIVPNTGYITLDILEPVVLRIMDMSGRLIIQEQISTTGRKDIYINGINIQIVLIQYIRLK